MGKFSNSEVEKNLVGLDQILKSREGNVLFTTGLFYKQFPDGNCRGTT